MNTLQQNPDWTPFRQLLGTIYKDLGLVDRSEPDAAYLKSAFDFTETLWHRQLERMPDVKIVMLSEAPLFGHKQTYIYNPDSPPTPFFHFNDLEAFGCILPKKNSWSNPQARKSFLIKQMGVKGILVLDLFPYALNPNDTAINYRKMSNPLYFRLLSETAPYYLIPKIQLARKKVGKTPIFIYRYKKLFQKTNHFVEALFVKNDIRFDGFKIESIHGENMSLDRKKLSQIYRQHEEDRG